jgi:hypothetical protein
MELLQGEQRVYSRRRHYKKNSGKGREYHQPEPSMLCRSASLGIGFVEFQQRVWRPGARV